MNKCSFVVIGVTIQTSESLLNWEIFSCGSVSDYKGGSNF